MSTTLSYYRKIFKPMPFLFFLKKMVLLRLGVTKKVFFFFKKKKGAMKVCLTMYCDCYRTSQIFGYKLYTSYLRAPCPGFVTYLIYSILGPSSSCSVCPVKNFFFFLGIHLEHLRLRLIQMDNPKISNTIL